MKDDQRKQTPATLGAEDERLAAALRKVAAGTKVNPVFQAELEVRLKDAYRPKGAASVPFLKKFLPTLAWIVALIVLVLVLDWAIRSLAPKTPLAAGNTSTPTVLFEEATPTPQPAATSTMEPAEATRQACQTVSYTVQANDTLSSISINYNVPMADIKEWNGLTTDNVYLNMPLTIPLCRRATTPGPILTTTPPAPTGSSFSWMGTTLYVSQPLPASPAEASVYLLQADQHATLDEARALAGRFDLQGDVYQTPGELSGTTDYVITDGKGWMSIRSDQYFTYYADYPNSNVLPGIETNTPQAAATIDQFLKSHGFDFEYKLEASDIWGGYYILPLTPDGFTVQHEFFRPAGLLIMLDGSGQVACVQADLVNYQPVGTYRLRPAEEAWKTVLNPNAATGVLEGFITPDSAFQTWQRTYPLNQTVTFYGMVSSIPSIDASQPPLVQIDRITVTGNLAGLDQLSPNSFVEATGQFVTQDGIEKFQLASWKVSGQIEAGIAGSLQRTGGQVTLTAQEGTFLLPDVPADLPMPFENVFVTGVILGNTFDWKTIDNRNTTSHYGGGGSSGLGFYKLNLSGTPVPLPTPTPTSLPAAQQPTGQKIDGQRGLLTVTIYQKPDGSQRTEYALSVRTGDGPFQYLLLEGNLQALQADQNRLVEIWGTLDHFDQNGNPVVTVDRYQVPFPDLKFQVLKGTQRTVQLKGQSAILFTAQEGQTYVQLAPNGDVDNNNLIGREGDPVLAEALVIPDEFYAGYPGARIFSSQMAVSPKDGQPTNLTITADQVNVTKELPAGTATNPAPPTATLESVGLVYYISNPRFISPDPAAGPAYLQPAWRFSGHYSNGDEFEILVQALQDEYLLPELAPFIPPG